LTQPASRPASMAELRYVPSRISSTSSAYTAPQFQAAPVSQRRGWLPVIAGDKDTRSLRGLYDGLGAVLVLGQYVYAAVDHGLDCRHLLGGIAPIAGQHKGGFHLWIYRPGPRRTQAASDRSGARPSLGNVSSHLGGLYLTTNLTLIIPL
jgi:hypothetical protein